MDELQRLLQDVPLELATAAALGLTLPADEPYATFLENATHKARYVARQTPHLVLGEDSGLEVDALGGKPGVRSKRYAGPEGDAQANNRKLLQDLSGVPWRRRQARFRCLLVLAKADTVLFTAGGTCAGLIANAPRGSGGFGYDPIFYLPELKQTMAELPAGEKNRLSHRARALEKGRAFIRQYAIDA